MMEYQELPCAFCSERALEIRTILEELPPTIDEQGEAWRQWRPFCRIRLCYNHAREFNRYRLSVREEARPNDDEDLGDGLMRTPAGWEYRLLTDIKSIGWVRSTD